MSQINRLTATLDEVAGKVTSLITHSAKTPLLSQPVVQIPRLDRALKERPA
jgi:hypothetical protein